MLRVSLAEVRYGAVETTGDVPPEHPAFRDAEWPLALPVSVRGRLSSAGEGKYFWRAHVRTAVRAECRRCLAPVDVPLELDLRLLFMAEADAPEGEGCYAVPPRAQELDLSPALREELFLALPRFVECRPDCRGLCARCGANLNQGPCGCTPEADPRWAALRALTRPEPLKD
jgi:uncharacterized protein